jgi:hypothetical protein
MGGCPLQFQEQHVLIPHAARAAEDGFDRGVDRFDDAKANGMVAVGGDALDMFEQKVAFCLSGCFSTPQSVGYRRAAAVMSDNSIDGNTSDQRQMRRLGSASWFQD